MTTRVPPPRCPAVPAVPTCAALPVPVACPLLVPNVREPHPLLNGAIAWKAGGTVVITLNNGPSDPERLLHWFTRGLIRTPPALPPDPEHRHTRPARVQHYRLQTNTPQVASSEATSWPSSRAGTGNQLGSVHHGTTVVSPNVVGDLHRHSQFTIFLLRHDQLTQTAASRNQPRPCELPMRSVTLSKAG